MNVLIKPIMTEKAVNQMELLNVYSFVVDKRANKIQIKEAIEQLYDVKVDGVRTMIYPVLRKNKYSKKGMIVGKKKSYKKAIVKLSGDDKIDVYNNL